MAPPGTPAPARTRRRPFGLPAALGRILTALAVLAGLFTVPQAAVAVDQPFPDTVQDTVTVDTGPAGVAVSPVDGRIWVTNYTGNSVSVIDPANGNSVTTIEDPSFNQPFGVAVTTDGRVWVTNYGATGNGTTVSVITPSDSSYSVATISGFSGPYGVAVSPITGWVWVTNAGTSKSVAVINPNDNSVSKLTPTTANPISPSGLAVGPDGTVWATDPGNDRLWRINPSLSFSTWFSGFTNPYGVTVAPDGRVWVVGGDGVAVLDSGSFDHVANVGTSYGVAVVGGRVWVAGTSSNSVYMIDPANDNSVTPITDPSFSSPYKVAVTADGRVWVTNLGGTTVSVLQRAFSVAFDLNGASGEPPLTQTVFLNETATEPLSDPSRPGYRFLGWSTEPDGSTGLFDFETQITSGPNILYAQWEAFGLRVEKFDTLDGEDATTGDFDEDPRTLAPGAGTPLSVTVENTGEGELTGFTFADETRDGTTGMVPEWSCDLRDFNVEAVIVSDDDDFKGLLASLVLPVGEFFTCTGELPALGWGASHTDEVTVTAVPVGGAELDLAEASDPWNAVTPEAPAPGVEVQKWVCETGTGCADPFGQDLIDLASGTAAGGWAVTARVDAGDTVDWLIVVHNTGNTALADVILSEEDIDPVGAATLDCAVNDPIAGSLAMDQIAFLVCSSTDVTGSHTNTVQASATPVDEQDDPIPNPDPLSPWIVSNEDDASVTVLTAVFVEKLAVNENNVLGPMGGSSWEIRSAPDGPVVPGSAVTQVMSDDPTPEPVTGLFEATGLETPGTYWLVETAAPHGFALLARPVQFTLNADGTVALVGASSNVSLADVDERGWTISVEDVPALVLPASGGPGDAWLRGPGAALVLAAGAAIGLLWHGRARRRRRRVVIGLGGPMSGSLRGPRSGSA